MTEQERRSLLETCTEHFQSQYCFVKSGVVKPIAYEKYGIEVTPEERRWGSIGFTGFRQPPGRYMWESKVIGIRSDGYRFDVPVELEGAFEETFKSVMAKLHDGYLTLQTFRDCACGSPCESHPQISEAEALT